MLADDLFRLAHHDRTGRPLLHASVAGLGLAAALLAELVVAEAIVIGSDQVCVVSRTPPPDVLAHTVLGQLAGEVAGHTVRTWLAFLSQTSRERVALRLLRSGHVRVETGRRLLTRSTVYVPTDSHVAVWPWARLSTRLRQGKPLDRFDTVLAGLLVATDLYWRVLDGAPGHVVAGLRQMVAVAPPSLRLLLSHTEAAVGDAVLTGH
ncbi:GOLPH3/VPS74 family protein [Salinispora arenicola]|uniref:GOLPH3/VPS74 family protein n=1 Tax=Salinispora arenicola TaxID=168697 RepID=UPI00169BE146|nr:GPP34 family phosphoprotein [Salinispora arenicola]NIL56946.1 GPP34 family phosphoprotein [Salinispora arenicola]NIL63056.1 GPP34 family phosphoprotein [Salinispora arenicola]